MVSKKTKGLKGFGLWWAGATALFVAAVAVLLALQSRDGYVASRFGDAGGYADTLDGAGAYAEPTRPVYPSGVYRNAKLVSCSHPVAGAQCRYGTDDGKPCTLGTRDVLTGAAAPFQTECTADGLCYRGLCCNYKARDVLP